MSDKQLVLLIIPTFIVFFTLIWRGVIYLIAWLSGWRRLATRYSTSVVPISGVETGLYARMGFANYNGVLSVGIWPEGLYLRPSYKLFSVGHKPLLIPWYALQWKGETGLLMTYATVEVKEEGITIQIPKKFSAEIQQRIIQ